MPSTISIIIPTYNRRHLIGTTIDNLLQQTHPAHEIIVVDDHSTDGTVEWLNTTYGNKLMVLTNKGKGPGAARNTGFQASTGNYIKFFDSDDVMTHNTLEEQLQALQASQKQFITGPYTYGQQINEQWQPTNNLLINYHGFPKSKPLYHWMIWGLFIPIPGMLFKRSFLEEVGPWPEECITSEDWAYLWRMALREPYPAHTNKCYFIYRVHEAQSTGSNFDDQKRDKEKFQILNEIYQHDVKHGNFTLWQKALFRNKFYQIARVTKDPPFRKELLHAAGPGQSLIWQYYRTKMKIGRVKTKSDWQPMHGILQDQENLSPTKV